MTRQLSNEDKAIVDLAVAFGIIPEKLQGKEWPQPPAPFKYSELNPEGLLLKKGEPLFLTYHTSGPNGAGYEEEAMGWCASMDVTGHKGRYIVLDAGGRQSWRQANMIKAGAIAWAVNAFRVPVLWIDCDARVRKTLTFFDNLADRCDVALSIRKVNDDGAVRWNVGTSWWNTTDLAQRALFWWFQWCKAVIARKGMYADVECDSNLFGLLVCEALNKEAHFEALRILNLPPEMCCIFDMDRERHPNIEPVIEQMQASRRKRGRHEPGRICWTMPTRGMVE